MKFQPRILSRPRRSSKRSTLIFYIWLLGLILRMAHLFLSRDNPLLYMPVLDEKYYVEMGRIIAAGDLTGGQGAFFMDPLYGYFLGCVFFLFGDNLTTVRLIQILIDSLNVFLIYSLGARVWKREAGIAASLCYALYPVAFFYSLLMLKTTLAISMLLLFTLLLIRSLESKGLFHWYALGVFSAFLTYLRGNMILLLPLVIVVIPIYKRAGWAGFAGKALIMILGFISALSAGALQNLASDGEFVLLNSQAGRLFYSCNNPQNLTGRYNVPDFARPGPVTSERDFQKEAERRKGTSLTPGEASRYWIMETLRSLSRRPDAIATLMFNKIKWTLGSCEIATNHSFYTAALFSPMLRWWPSPFAFALALGIPGLLLGLIRERRVIVLLVPLLMVLGTVMIFYSSSRLRMPAVPFLLAGAGILFSILSQWLREGKMVKALATVFSVCLLGICSLSVPCPPPSGTDTFLLAKAYWRLNDLEQAERLAAKGTKDFPTQARFHLLLGMVAFSRNHPDRAIEEYQRALELDPDNVDALYNIGLIFLYLKRPGEASGWFQKALGLEERPDILFHLAMTYEAKGDRETAVRNYRRCLDLALPHDRFRVQARQRLMKLLPDFPMKGKEGVM